MDPEQWKAAAIEAGFTPKQVDFLLQHGVPHTHDADQIWIDRDNKLDLDEWSSGVEDTFEELGASRE